MSLGALLAAIVPGTPETQRAALETLRRELLRIATARAGSGPLVPGRLREDVVQAVLISLWKRSLGGPLPVCVDDARAYWYVRTALERRFWDLSRKAGHDPLEKVEAVRAGSDAVEAIEQLAQPPEEDLGAVEAERALEESRRLLETLFERVLSFAAAQNAYHAEWRKTWSEMSQIAFDGRALDELLTEGGAHLNEPGDLIKARQRAWKAHERLRTRLQDAVSRLEDGGEWAPSVARRARELLRLFLRGGVRSGAGLRPVMRGTTT